MNTIYAPAPDPRLLADIAADVAELIRPFTRKVWRQNHTWTPARNKRVHRWSETIAYPCLLDQLSAAVTPVQVPSRAMRPSRVPASRPPIAIDPSSRLAEIRVEVAWWMAHLELRAVTIADSPWEDWWKQAIWRLGDRAPRLDPIRVDELAAAVRKWWEWAAVQSGWSAWCSEHETTDTCDLRAGRAG